MIYDGSKSLLRQMRDAAKVECDELVAFNLRNAADDLDMALKQFALHPNGDKLVAVNSFWAHGIRCLAFSAPRPEPGGTGAGLFEGPLIQVAA